MGKPLIIWRNWFYRWIRDVQLLWSYDFFLRKTAFYNGKFLISGGCKVGLKIFAPSYQKAHPYAKSGRTNRLALWQWRCFDTIRRREKSTRESPLENRVVYNTTNLHKICKRRQCPHNKVRITKTTFLYDHDYIIRTLYKNIY